jgi:hypothetical protein
MITETALDELVGTTFPEGTYRIGGQRNADYVGAVHSGSAGLSASPDVAHPVFGFLATHCGMGVTLEEFFTIVGATLEDGVLFGEGTLDFEDVVRTDTTYRVTGGIVRTARKVGRQTGTFDTITVRFELLDGDRRVCTSEETYVFPRSEESR